MRKLLIILFAILLAVPATAQRKTTTAKKTTTTRKSSAKTTRKKQTKAAKKTAPATVYTNASIKGLQNQRADIQKKIKEQEKALRANQADVKDRLKNLLVINSEIEDRQKSITGIEQDIAHIDGNIDMLTSQLETLRQQLKERQRNFIKSMRYMSRHRSAQDKLMFIFSAKDFAQMYRRLRFVREYASY